MGQAQVASASVVNLHYRLKHLLTAARPQEHHLEHHHEQITNEIENNLGKKEQCQDMDNISGISMYYLYVIIGLVGL